MMQTQEFLLQCREFHLCLGRKTHVMGVLNVTPDSFSDGGRYRETAAAVRRACKMVEEGADIIDVGGESTRPGADAVPLQEELKRILPVIERLAERLSVPISIDTSKSSVAREAIKAGARIINDITGLLRDPQMVEVAAETDLPVVIMHMKGTPMDMQINPTYHSVVQEISAFFHERIASAVACGITRQKIILDPGIGFGKTVRHNLEILHSLSAFHSLGQPLLIGPSRKSFIGQVLDLPVSERGEGTAAAVAVAVLGGAHIIRVHDVREMVRVARMVDAIKAVGSLS